MRPGDIRAGEHHHDQHRHHDHRPDHRRPRPGPALANADRATAHTHHADYAADLTEELRRRAQAGDQEALTELAGTYGTPEWQAANKERLDEEAQRFEATLEAGKQARLAEEAADRQWWRDHLGLAPSASASEIAAGKALALGRA